MEEFVPSFLRDDADTEPLNTNNGLVLMGNHVPEMVFYILSLVEPSHILKCSLVCRQWNAMVKSYTLWSCIYKRKYNRKPKALPWYIYYMFLTTDYLNKNMLAWETKSDAKFDYWKLPYLNNQTECGCSCGRIKTVNFDPRKETFVLTMKTHIRSSIGFHVGYVIPMVFKEIWLIKFTTNKLFQYIMDKYKPHIYIRQCGSLFELNCGTFVEGQNVKSIGFKNRHGAYRQDGSLHERTKYEEVELVIDKYPKGIRGITFETRRFDNATSRIANGVIRISLESINNLSDAKDEAAELHFNRNVLF